MNPDNLITQYDTWLDDESPVAALVMRQWLVSVEGRDSVIFPPTYAPPQEGKAKDDWSGYNIDCLPDGSTVCQIDSVGSQANRMEPIFKREKYQHLVPQIVINANGQQINLLDAGHRAADAIVRFSGIKSDIETAFNAIHKSGDAKPIAKLAPTSIVFGIWDSRSTQLKLPRVVRSVIRAINVDKLHRSAQYTTIAGQILDGAEVEVTTKGAKAELGFAHVPAAWSHGGLRLRANGEIRREAALNLVAIRSLGCKIDPSDAPKNETLILRRYILGLALVAFTAPQETALREGCQLVPDLERPAQWELVHHDGKRDERQLSHSDALAYAVAAAAEFEVGKSKNVDFDIKEARTQLSKSKDDRKADKKKNSKEVKE